MNLSDRARQVAAAAPLHQSAAVLRECAAELDHLSHRADHLGTSAQEWYGMWNIANERANKAEADLAALREAVWALPEYEHEGPGDGYGCPARHDRGIRCQCDAGEANAALAAARKLAGLGE